MDTDSHFLSPDPEQFDGIRICKPAPLNLFSTQDIVSSVVSSESAGDLERVYDVLEVKRGRVVRILTCLFPKYFAIVTRVRQEVRSMDQVHIFCSAIPPMAERIFFSLIRGKSFF